MYLTRSQVIKRWGDILEYRHEIYVWLYCNRKTDMDVITYVNNLFSKVETFREEVKHPSDLEALDRMTLLMDCHSIGLEFISLSRGKLLPRRRAYEVEWQDPNKFSNEEIEKWGKFFKYLLECAMCVDFCYSHPFVTDPRAQYNY